MEYRDLRIPFFTVLFLFVFFYLLPKIFGPLPLAINNNSNSDQFTVEGVGEAKGVADTANFTVGISAYGNTEQAARQDATRVVNQLKASLRKIGVDEKGVKAKTIYVNPEHTAISPPLPFPTPARFSKPNIQPVEAGGYTATQDVEINVKPIAKAQEAYDAALASGAYIVNEINYTFDDTQHKELRKKARVEAIKNAKANAEELSQLSGIRLGKIINIYDSSIANGVDYNYPADNAMGGNETTVRSSVSLTYKTH